MPHNDFKPPVSNKESLQRFSLELNCLMVLLRNEAQFHDAMDPTVLDIAQLVASILADSLKETEQLIPMIEARVTGADMMDEASLPSHHPIAP